MPAPVWIGYGTRMGVGIRIGFGMGAALLLAAAACGGSGSKTGSEPARDKTAGGAASSSPAAVAALGPRARAVAVDWQDPEPPGAQALAEAVVESPWNQNKTLALVMRITTLESKTTGVGGFATTLAARETSVEDRLARLGASVTETEITIRLPGSILFDFDSADLRPDAERTLGDLSAVFAAYAKRPARVEGHTDSIASDDYNQKLSQRRAAAVVRWLSGHGVESTRLTSSGWGETRPVADNGTAAGRQRNRRVEVVIAKAG